MKRPKQPCDRDCTNRAAECKITCNTWKEYEIKQREYREWRANEMLKNSPAFEYRKDRKTKEVHSAHMRKR